MTSTDGETRPAKTLRDIALDPREFDAELMDRCNADSHTPELGMFFPRECCAHHRKYDSRTLDLFKLEKEGVHMIGLSSKTYCLQKHDGTVKVTSKGLRPSNIVEPLRSFSSVISMRQTASSENLGFRAHLGTVYTYRQVRAGLSWFYIKRLVRPDGIHTDPLKIIICPWNDQGYDIVDSASHPSWPLTSRSITVFGHTFNSLEAACKGAMSTSNPEGWLTCAVEQIDYKAQGRVVFASCGFREREMQLKMSSGLTGRCIPMVSAANFPGHNYLGEICDMICI